MIPIHIVWENMFYKACSCICKQGEQLLKLLVYACTKSRNKTFKISRQSGTKPKQVIKKITETSYFSFSLHQSKSVKFLLI